ncbi:hypothetical protein BGZ47_007924 [Haplosporangium gracile]|nr:hypothetical protein BGZ47_007924 [Haplosporangium gracile]
MPSNTLPEIQTVFSEYRAERYPAAVEAFDASFLKEIEPKGTVSPVESASAVKARGVYRQRNGPLTI